MHLRTAAPIPRRVALVLAAALAAFAPAHARAQEPGTLTVTVIDADSGDPLERVRVRIAGETRGVTDTSGVARVTGLARGARLAVELSRTGYAPRRMQVEMGDLAVEEMVELTAVRAAASTDADPRATLSARRRAIEEFRQRSRRGRGGLFATRAEIERRDPRTIGELFPSLPAPRGRAAPAPTLRSARAGTAAAMECAPLHYVDGVRSPVERGATLQSLMDDIDAEFRPSDVEGVEVYPPGATPPPFVPSRGLCGVVLVWTRLPGG